MKNPTPETTRDALTAWNAEKAANHFTTDVDLQRILRHHLGATAYEACAPGALGATKALMAQARLRAPQDLVHEAAAVFSQAAQGPEGLEGMTAFIQKRKPQWAMP